MTNAEKFQKVFGYYATEMWAKPEKEFLEWINAEALEQEPIISCKDCKHWHEWENGTGSCHRSGMMWVGSDYDDYCSYAERMESDAE